MAGAPDPIHIQPTAEPYKVLGAPATELALITAKPGVSQTTIGEKTNELVAIANALPAEWGVISAVWGPIVEKDDVCLDVHRELNMLQHHWKAVSTVPELIQHIENMYKIADVALAHPELSERN